MIQTKARILENSAIAEGIYKMVLEAPEIAGEAKPGQFVMVRCSDTFNPLLRRPFSICQKEQRGLFNPNPEKMSIIYKVVGKGTSWLCKKQRGDFLDVIGPLGNSFKLKEGNVFFVGGGIGIASLVSLADELAWFSKDHSQFYVLLGEKTENLAKCLGEEEARGLGYESGLVTDLLLDVLNCPDNYYCWPEEINAIYACGPYGMLKKVSRLAKERQIFCQVSLEARLGCGIGACLGCVIKTRKGNKRVCKDGPIFNAQEVIWDEI